MVPNNVNLILFDVKITPNYIKLTIIYLKKYCNSLEKRNKFFLNPMCKIFSRTIHVIV